MKKATALLLAAGFVLMTTAQVQASDKIIASGKIIAPAPVIAHQNVYIGTIHGHGSATYTDLGGHFSGQSVTRLTDMGLLPRGTTFQPTANIERKDMKAWIQNVAGVAVTDTNPDAQYVTRLEVAQWMATSLPAMNTGINGGLNVYPFDDTPNLTDNQRTALISMYNLGIMIGDGHHHFSPNALLARGEAAVMLDRVQTRTLSVGKPVTYDTLTGMLPESANTLFDENKTEAGLYSVTDNGVRYVIVSGGEVPTGGFSVTLDKFSETDAGIFVHATLHAPDSSTMVSQLVSYPHVALKISDVNKPIYLIED